MSPSKVAPATAKEENFGMLRNLRVADYLTLSNGLCGVLSIYSSAESRFLLAYALIFVGYEFDRFDGKVARWRNECSEMGKELDSLSDLITFVTAPAFMLYSLGLRTAIDEAALSFYVLCGIARLARFNIAAHLVPRDENGKPLYHQGLPTPYAGLLIGTAVAVSAWMGWTSSGLVPGVVLYRGRWWEFHPASGFVLALGSMMISGRLKLKLDGGITIPAATAAIFAVCWSLTVST